MGLFGSIGKAIGKVGAFTPIGAGLSFGLSKAAKGIDPGGSQENSGFPGFDSSSIGEGGQIGAMRAKLEAMKPEAFNYKRRDNSGPLAEFDYNRNKLGEQFNTQQQAGGEAISRRFAALGNMGSGSAIKAQQIHNQNTAKARGDAFAGLGAEESKARRSLDETENQREFQVGMQNNQTANQFQQFKAGEGSKLSALDLQHRQMEQQRRQDAYQNDLNQYKQKNSGGLLGGGGFLGTGL